MAQQSQPAFSPRLAMPFGILAVSTASIFIRYAQAGAPSIVIAAARLTLASLVLAGIVIIRHRSDLRALTGELLWPALLSGFFLAIHFAAWITSLEYTTVASSVVLVTTTPLWVALVAPWAINEPISRTVLIGMFLAMGGGVVVALSDSCTLVGGALVCPPLADFVAGKAFWGDLLALVGAWTGAAYLIIGRRLREQLSLIPYIFLVFGMAAILLNVFMFLAGETPFGYSGETYLWFLLLALVPQLLGHSALNWALRYLPAAYVSISLLGEPIGSAVLAYFLLGEIPSMLTVFGAILIFAGVYLAGSR